MNIRNIHELFDPSQWPDLYRAIQVLDSGGMCEMCGLSEAEGVSGSATSEMQDGKVVQRAIALCESCMQENAGFWGR